MDYLERHRDRILEDEERARDMEGRGTRGLPPSKKYRADPGYARVPIAICDNSTIGLPTCPKGEGKYCYCKEPCESQMRLDNPKKRIPAAEKLYQESKMKAIHHAREKASRMTPREEEGLDNMCEMLLAMARAERESKQGGSGNHGKK